jgi:hypothetical protein
VTTGYAFYCPDCHREVEETEECLCGPFRVLVQGTENWVPYADRTYDHAEATDLVRALRTLTTRSYRIVRGSL